MTPSDGDDGHQVAVGSVRLRAVFDGPVEAVVVNEVAVAVLYAFLIPVECAHQLVVAAPERKTGVVLEARDLFFHLGLHLGEKLRRRGIERAGEHEILPDQEAKFVAGVVEAVGLVAPAAPDPDHVHVGVGGRVQEIAGLLRGDPARQGVGHDPVCALGEDIAAVDADLEAGARVVRLGDQVHRPQADAAMGRSVAAGQTQVMQDLRPLPVRPPQFGVLDVEHQRRAAALYLCGRLGPGQRGGDIDALRIRHGRDDHDPRAARRMALVDEHVGNARRARRLQPDIAVEPERGKRDVPVPAEIGLDLAQHVAVRDRVVLGVGHREGLFGLAFGGLAHRGAEGDLDRVFAFDRDLGEIHPVAAELVLCLQHDRAVPTDLGHAIEPRDDEFVFGGIEQHHAARRPVALADPAQVMFVAAPIGVGDQPGLLQRRHAVAGERHVAGVVPGFVGQCPEPRE